MWVIDGVPFLFSSVLHVDCSTRCSAFLFNKISLFKIIESLVRTLQSSVSEYFVKSDHSRSNVSISELYLLISIHTFVISIHTLKSAWF